mmetsp:Transcript_4866/g.5624  ORF Transcript_4866/g.5624 Transcript_4866/m.5624 type:complete len:387 (-) Transcript_4866:151-1311(-)|eukprot:CAMPEP_0184021566 /NCGR_PEP_ID=MMETSP0954-20121128/10012_1 /TAXON_ID=627963 /ORGANISM="Aplanochytrium sp, Strain PBS07" /LENGTH=386 /DNA_ID=CAMNT_0026303625 /DNA_START=266 /DNA_END=1426 /DNA_ORIENTATION=-
MGNCVGSQDEEYLRNKAIEKEMARAKNVDESKIKILLLGAGESGKSTLFKQMKILFSETKNFSQEERRHFVSVIHGNIISDLKIMINACATHTPIKDEDAAAVVSAMKGKKAQDDALLGPDDLHVLEALWNDAGMQQSWEDRGDIQVQDALAYYMADISRVCGVDGEFVPTNNDILHSRVRTSGVVEEQFSMGEAKFAMYDVGGQRNERRKWIHSFQNVTTVMFVAAISEYNQVLYEDNRVNRQDEAVQLFRQQLESEWFIKVPFILFLNKVDLFREKLPHIPFKLDSEKEKRNLDYDGPECDPNTDYSINGDDENFELVFKATTEYLKNLYESQADLPHIAEAREGAVYTHFTNSTDSSNVERIMTACKDIILKDNLRAGGWFTD